MSITNFSWRHKEHRFVTFVYGPAGRIISNTDIYVSFLFSSFSKHNWRERKRERERERERERVRVVLFE